MDDPKQGGLEVAPVEEGPERRRHRPHRVAHRARFVQLQRGKVGGGRAAHCLGHFIRGTDTRQPLGQLVQRPVRIGEGVGDRGADGHRGPHAARVVVRHPGAVSRILDQPQRVAPPTQRDGRAAHHRAVACRPAARLLPDRGRCRRAPGARPRPGEHLVGLAAHATPALRRPAE